MSNTQPKDKGLQPRSKPAWSSLGLCDICRETIARPDYSDVSWDVKVYKHHSSQDDLLEAAEKRCYICQSLRNKLSEPSFRFPSSEQPKTATCVRFWFKYEFMRDHVLIFFCGYVESSLTQMLTLKINHFADPAQPATGYPEESTWSATNIQRAKRWLRAHSADDFVSDSTRLMPKRLLRVQASEKYMYQVKLCDNATMLRGAQYLTLSHCWGDIDFLRLREDNINKLKEYIKYQSLTKTFRDAIRVTCDLGFEYLWIDSFCIIQDSEEDWLSQGSIMGQIYQNAACNISADVARNGSQGLIRSRDINTFLPLKVRIRSRGETGRNSKEHSILIHESWEDTVGGAPLGNRAWVLQERLLSRRIIHFTTRQLFFESKDKRRDTNNCSEQWPSGVPGSSTELKFPREDQVVEWWNRMTGNHFNDEKRLEVWARLVETYNQMRLTYETDRLAALSGVVKEVQSHSGDDYVAGLWKKDLLYHLLWHSTHLQSCPRTQPYTAPTWSWASIGSAISYQFIPTAHYNHKLFVEFVEAQISAKLGKETTGAIKDGLLRLRGPLRQAWLNQGNHKPYQNYFWTIGGSRKRIYFLPDDLCTGRTIETINPEVYIERLFWAFEESQAKSFEPQSTITVHVPTQSVFLLPILSAFPPDSWGTTNDFTTVGLTLIPTDKGRGQFQRVGLFFTLHKSELGCILHLPSHIEECYYEKKDRGRYTISII